MTPRFLAFEGLSPSTVSSRHSESFPIPADPSQSLLTYTAEPGSPSQGALNLLASRAATTADQTDDRAVRTSDSKEQGAFGPAD